MAILHFSQEDFQSIPVLNFTIPSLASDLTANTANVGKIYLNTGSGRVRFHRTSAIIENLSLSTFIADADVASGAAIAESKLSLASDAAAGTASRRTLAFTSTTAMPGNARLDQIAAPTASVPMGSQKFTGLTAGTASGDSVEFAQMNTAIQNAIQGNDWKQSVRVASTANVTVASGLTNGSTMDGVTLATGDRVLLKNQTTASENGIYLVVASGAASRAPDADNSNPTNEVTSGMTVPIEGGGSTNGGTLWLLAVSGAVTLGTTALTFTQIGGSGASYTAGTGITLTGNVFSLTAPVTVALGGTNATTVAAARTSLGVPRVGGGPTTITSALVAGTELTIAHGFAVNGLAEIRDVSTHTRVEIKTRVDATNIYLTADMAVTSSTLEYVFNPVAS